jgi:hypothetical protein
MRIEFISKVNCVDIAQQIVEKFLGVGLELVSCKV